jgi:hypothetical protein
MHKSATKCNETLGKWCKNKHGASKIIVTLETYHHRPGPPSKPIHRPLVWRTPHLRNPKFIADELPTPEPAPTLSFGLTIVGDIMASHAVPVSSEVSASPPPITSWPATSSQSSARSSRRHRVAFFLPIASSSSYPMNS